ncbi:cisplatin damage response ATP-dependent DNA ligase [Glaciecola sp. 1036]|uniref:cisplatin damage response ATP-dependent DNA ligase n=1 Tax=Alteromonadaceae TaxID=72275 RepID=UPI003D0339D9
MRAFATLVDKLYFTSGNLAKAALIKDYLKTTPDPDRGWAIAAIAGTLNFDFFKRKLIKDLISERVDPVLFDLSYDYVGEMSETVAHLWHSLPDDPKPLQQLPSLSEVVAKFAQGNKAQNRNYLIQLLNSMQATQRWALLKLGTRGLRIGVSARFLKKILAEYGQQHSQEVSIEKIERLWHGLAPPYTELLSWLEGKSAIPDVSEKVVFQPVMLSHPLDEKSLPDIVPQDYIAEWKFDGIRVQLVISEHGKAIFSRTGDDISHSFPDIMQNLDHQNISGVFDGELIVIQPKEQQNQITGVLAKETHHIGSFNQLQQRLNKKKPSNKLIQQYPAGLILYDCLSLHKKDLRQLVLTKRKQFLKSWFDNQPYDFIHFSEELEFASIEQLTSLREQATTLEQGYIEGLMLKAKDSQYVAGRPKGAWYKWKREPRLIDAVIMYAQRGHGKRSSFYSDYTFGCWQQDKLLPIGKAYSGFTDDELKQLDRWVRNNTIGRFGPVKEVNKALVFEVAFDSVHESNRHKSGLALRFPRIHRIRWDKPAEEADSLETLKSMLSQ